MRSSAHTRCSPSDAAAAGRGGGAAAGGEAEAGVPALAPVTATATEGGKFGFEAASDASVVARSVAEASHAQSSLRAGRADGCEQWLRPDRAKRDSFHIWYWRHIYGTGGPHIWAFGAARGGWDLRRQVGARASWRWQGSPKASRWQWRRAPERKRAILARGESESERREETVGETVGRSRAHLTRRALGGQGMESERGTRIGWADYARGAL